MRLYHTGYSEIKDPDIHYGRKNADLGQGFYTTDSRDFALRWAKERRGSDIYVNTYELDEDGLSVLRLDRDDKWFDLIFNNRSGHFDTCPEADVIIGPIANDTIYDTLGIMTSGFLSREESMELLSVDPEYIQTVIRSEKAASQLTWLGSEILSPESVAENHAILKKEETAYQEAISRIMLDWDV